MKKTFEQRPVDTKVLRENFKRALERNMNKLMSEGYVPMGGVSTHMNTNTRPVLGMDSKEYTQTMVKYADFEIWIRETDEDRSAHSDEQARQSLIAQQDNVKKVVSKDLQTIKKLEELLEESESTVTPKKKSFLGSIKQSFDTSRENSRKKRLESAQQRLAANKERYIELKEQISVFDKRLDPYYKSNPNVTKDILLNSR